MNKNTFIGQMVKRLSEAPEGSTFIVSDFTDLMDYETAKKSIARLEKSGVLRRVLRGVYDKPKFSILLQEFAAPNPDSIAKALARNYNWTISPNGDTALNLLGLSTQVPAKWSYISSGPNKSYLVDRIRIDFIHRADREIIGMSEKTALVIQALKALGIDGIDANIISSLQRRLSSKEKAMLLQEARQTTNWIYSVIKLICKEPLRELGYV